MSYEKWRDRLLEALDSELFPPEFLDGAIRSGAQFLENETAAIVFGIKTYPTGAKVLHGLCAAGETGGIKELIAQAEHIGRQAGCIRTSIESRPAWARLLPDYEVYQVCIMKEL